MKIKRNLEKWIARFLVVVMIITCVPGFNYSKARAVEKNIETNQILSRDKDTSVSAASSFGKLLQEPMSNQAKKHEENNGYNVFSVEMSGKTAAVSMETVEDCTLVVGIYEEDGIKMLATGNKKVTKEEREVTLDIEIDTMPQYYLVRAFLIEDDTMNPLCSVYETPMYTKEMQDFLSKTTDDFEEERVLNLDEDKTNNFAVYGEDTKIIKGSDDNNCLKCTNEEKQNYVIEKADASAASLTKGDVFAYERENQEVVIVKVSSVSVEGSTVTINGEDTDLEDVFEYVKIDETATTADMEVDASECSEGVEYQGKENNSAGRKKAISGEGNTSVSLSYRFTGKDSPLNGSVKLAITTSLKVYISWQYQYLEFTSQYSLANEWKLELQTEIKIKLGEVVINPVPGLYIKLTPSFLVEVAGSVGITGTIEGCTGYSASPQDGFKDLTSAPSLDEEKTELKIGGSIFIGFSLEPSITVVTKKLVTASATAKVGLELTISNDYWEELDDATEKHDCSNCFEGEVYAKGEISASLKFFDDESFEISGKKEKKFKISDVYWCIQHAKFAFSSCPYHQYKVTVIAKNPDGTLIKDATVNQDFRTNSNGEAYLWFTRGKHKLSVSKNGEDQVSKVIDVAGKARKITIQFKTNSSVDDEAGDDGDDNGDNGDNGNIGLESNPLAGKKIKKVLPGDIHESAVITENGDLYEGAIMGDEGVMGSKVIKILPKVKQVKQGGHYKGAITENGDLYMWGDNEYGQIGDGTTEDKYSPVKVLSNIKEFAVSELSSGAITENGDLYMWGNNLYGQIGDGTGEDKYNPVKVLSNVKKIALCYKTCGAITEDGDLYMWGCNDYGQIGDGTREQEHKYSPVKVLSNVKEVVVGTSSSGAITENGDLYMWGGNAMGEIGDGTTEEKYSPVKVLSNVKKFEVDWSSGAITENGDLYMWGPNEHGEIGDGTTEDKYSPVKVLSNVKEIAFGLYFNGAITENGDLYMWGNNKHGQIGDGTTEDKYSPVKVLSNAKEVAVSMYHGGAITEDGDLFMWGYLLSGTNENKYAPLQINAPLPTKKTFSKSNKKLATQSDVSPQIYTWTGRASGWGGPGSYPSSANHEQGISGVTYDPANTNIKSSVGYGCGLELMNPYNDTFTGEENELAQILKTMKKPCIRVTLENGGTAHGWNWDKQLEFPSGKNIVFPEGYFDTQYLAIFGDDDTLTSVQIYDASLFTLGSDSSILPVKSFENLDVNVTYNYYILKSKDTEDVLSGSNLLYVGQGVTDSSGILCATYEMKEDCEEPIILLKKLEKNSVVDAKITMSDLRYNKQEQYINPTVTYQGETLVEGEDYELSGDFSASEIGTYTVTICGIGNFSGFVDKTYDVYCSHQFGDWIITKQPTANSMGIQKRVCSLCKYEEKKTIAKLQSTPVPTKTGNAGNTGNSERQNSTHQTTTVKKPSKVSGLTVKNKKKKKMIISWRWKANVSGFQIQYAQNKKFTKKKKNKSVGKWTDKTTISKLKKGKTYYVRIRAYKKSSSRKIYGKWSKIKKIKIKK